MISKRHCSILVDEKRPAVATTVYVGLEVCVTESVANVWEMIDQSVLNYGAPAGDVLKQYDFEVQRACVSRESIARPDL